VDQVRALNLAYEMEPADAARCFIVRATEREQKVTCVIFHNYNLPRKVGMGGRQGIQRDAWERARTYHPRGHPRLVEPGSHRLLAVLFQVAPMRAGDLGSRKLLRRSQLKRVEDGPRHVFNHHGGLHGGFRSFAD
jgi:hypothetical protein